LNGIKEKVGTALLNIRQIKTTMIRLFDQLPLYVRFGLAFLLPVLVIAWVTASNILQLSTSVSQIDRLKSNLALTVDAGQLVGNLQDERGYSVLRLKTGASAFGQRLQQSQQRTDTVLAALEQRLESTTPAHRQSATYKNLSEILRDLSQLKEIRSQITTATINSNEVIAFYSKPIAAFNQQISRLSRDVRVPEFARQLNAYFILNRLRELLGQERVLIANALAEQQLAAEGVKQLAYLTGRQQSLLVGLQNQTAFADKVNLNAMATSLRQQLLSTDNTQQLLANSQLQNWYQQQSELIEQVRQVEVQLISQLTNSAQQQYASASNELWRYAVISPLALIMSLLLAILILRFVKRRMLLSEKVFNHSHDRITVSDAEGNIVDVNPAFTRMTGFKKQEVLGKNPRFLQSGRQDKRFYKAMWTRILRDGFWQGELWNRRKDGELYAEQSSISVIRDNHGNIQNFIAISSDVTERAEAHQRELEHQAYHDALTGLPNVMLIRDRLEHAINLANRDNKRVVVASLDIDNFKKINDKFGHVIGDKTIECMAKRLNNLLRGGDTLGRVTGDEFIFVLEGNGNAASLNNLLERIREEASNPMRIDGRTIQITASIGVTAYPDDKHDADTLIRHATQALHLAKRKGRDQVNWFDAEREREQTQLTQLIKSLNNAMQNKQLVLFYQPKVDMKNCQIVGVEALLRWQKEDGEFVAPGEFLPYIESHPFSIEIGDYVIEQALTQLENWQQQKLQLPVSVNVSAVQLLDERFVETLAMHLRNHPSVDPAWFEIEILESAAIGKINEAARVIERCKALGVSVSLDDFGTGYAALDYLKRLPAQTLKIDQSFVRDMQSDDTDMTIVKGIIGLADAFGFGVIAEGVETPEQGRMLVELGCNIGQGYGIAKPMPADKVAHWVSTWKCPQDWRF
jgi:diguanylate cyclase (GGDEF)-like protein/PAS domain S-box-containing protein